MEFCVKRRAINHVGNLTENRHDRKPGASDGLWWEPYRARLEAFVSANRVTDERDIIMRMQFSIWRHYAGNQARNPGILVEDRYSGK